MFCKHLFSPVSFINKCPLLHSSLSLTRYSQWFAFNFCLSSRTSLSEISHTCYQSLISSYIQLDILTKASTPWRYFILKLFGGLHEGQIHSLKSYFQSATVHRDLLHFFVNCCDHSIATSWTDRSCASTPTHKWLHKLTQYCSRWISIFLLQSGVFCQHMVL